MEDYFVKLDIPDELRKKLLETSKDIVRSLQTHENLRQIRVEKLEEIIRLRSIMKDIDNLMLRLRKLFPVVETQKKEKFRKPVYRGKQEKLVEVKSPKIDELQEELRKIEERLNRIS